MGVSVEGLIKKIMEQEYNMPYTVRVSVKRGSMFDYGTEQYEITLPQGLDEQDIFNGVAQMLKKVNADK